jgi:hypothetical protein
MEFLPEKDNIHKKNGTLRVSGETAFRKMSFSRGNFFLSSAVLSLGAAAMYSLRVMPLCPYDTFSLVGFLYVY